MLETVLQPNETKERCGLLLKDGSIIEISNLAPEPETGYYMDSQAVLPFLEGEQIAGTWHTHPQSPPILSGDDLDSFLAWPSLEHYVIGREGDKVVVIKYVVKEGAVIQCN